MTLARAATLEGAALTLTATPSGAADRVLYCVDGQPAGQSGPPSFALTLATDQLFRNGSHEVTARAFAASGLVASAPPVTFTLANAMEQGLANPGFEAGLRGWEVSSPALLSFDPTGQAPHGGFRMLTWSLARGDAEARADLTLTIPAGMGWAQLEYWAKVEAPDPSKTGDGLTAIIRDDGLRVVEHDDLILDHDDETGLLSDVMEALSDPLFDVHGIKAVEVRDMVGASPAIARALLTLYQAARRGHATKETLPGVPANTDETALGELSFLPAGMPSEEVSDFLQANNNYFHDLELAAEALWKDNDLSLDNLYGGLVLVLNKRFTVTVDVIAAEVMENTLREYRPLERRLSISEMLPLSSRTIQLASQIALLGCEGELSAPIARGKFTSHESELLARTALADPMVGSTQERAKRIMADCRACRAEAVVISRIPGASHSAWEGASLRSIISRELGLPTLELEIPSVCDAMLPTLAGRIQALIETARARRPLFSA